jgi:vacuolar-type H+-ATPase subunit I/STV1
MSLRSLLTALLLLLCGSITAAAQTAPKFPGNIPNDKPAAGTQEDPLQPLAQREMIKEMELKREAGDYKEHLARAKENAQLAAELKEIYSRQKALHEPELKKLSRMEKLARQIRSRAGGEENKDELKEAPPQIEPALERLAELSTELQKKVESTPRQVVSAAVIKRANEVVELVKYIRTLYR